MFLETIGEDEATGRVAEIYAAYQARPETLQNTRWYFQLSASGVATSRS